MICNTTQTEQLSAQEVSQHALDLMSHGRMQEGLRILKHYVQTHPDDARMHSLLLFFTHYQADHDRAQLALDYQAWAERHAPVTRARSGFDRNRDPERRLRIGYLSPDFYTHAVMNHFKVLFSHGNRERFEIYAYGSVQTPDALTERVAQYSDVYRPVYHLDDSQLAHVIEQDRIDILVNLAGQVAGHRLGALAYKPAPIQIDYQGINTTGMPQIDVRLSDDLLDPADAEAYYVERTVRLPRALVCLIPPQPCPEVGSLPYQRHGVVTFGSFNAALKVNRSVVSLWSQVLREVPYSRLYLKLNTSSEDLMEQYYAWFEQDGIARDRLTLQSRTITYQEHLGCYNQIDISLDTYPFNGCVTTLESLWMGVPVISLTGPRFISRMGLSLLTHAGLGLFVTDSPARYMAKAAALAANPVALGQIRSTLRQRLAQGPLCDTRGYMRDLEGVYRRLWRQWCLSAGEEKKVRG